MRTTKSEKEIIRSKTEKQWAAMVGSWQGSKSRVVGAAGSFNWQTGATTIIIIIVHLIVIIIIIITLSLSSGSHFQITRGSEVRSLV